MKNLSLTSSDIALLFEAYCRYVSARWGEDYAKDFEYALWGLFPLPEDFSVSFSSPSQNDGKFTLLASAPSLSFVLSGRGFRASSSTDISEWKYKSLLPGSLFGCEVTYTQHGNSSFRSDLQEPEEGLPLHLCSDLLHLCSDPLHPCTQRPLTA